MTTEEQTIQTMRASFMPIAEKCPGALRQGQEEGVTIRVDADKITAGGNATHEVCREIVATGDRPEDLTPWVEKWHCDPDHLGRSTWYALQFWREFRGAFPDPQTEKALDAPLGTTFDAPITLTGHVDLLSVVEAVEGRVLDWKAGYRTDVDVEPQMRSYAYLESFKYDLPKVTATVVWLADQTYQTWTWTAEELWHWGKETVRAIREWDGKYTVGDHCRYCPRFFNCPAQKTLMRSTVQDLVRLDDSSGELSPARIGQLYPAVQNVERLCKVFRDLARNAVEASGPIPVDDDGMELALVASHRQTIEPLAAWPVISARLDDQALAGCMTVRKTELLKAVAAGAPRGQKGLAKTEIMDELKAADAVKSTEITSLRIRRRKDEGTTETEGDKNHG